MTFEPIDVTTRDEYRAAQEPLGFTWRGRRFEIVEIIDRWYEGHLDSTRLPLLYFRVKIPDGTVRIIRYHELFRAWAIVVPREEAGE
jgi:hypothetical protein